MSKTPLKDQRREYNEQTKRELYMKSAGRCAKCNIILYEDNHTGQKANLSQKAHIDPIKPHGPRGNEPSVKDKKVNDVTNLLLLCGSCHKIVDVDYVEDYPVETLKSLKSEHELRIRMVTEVTPDLYTSVLCFVVNTEKSIFQEPTHNDIAKATTPYFPKLDSSDKIVFNPKFNKPRGSSEFYSSIKEQTTALVNGPLTNVLNQQKRLSIFAQAPIPLLIHLGLEIGSGNNCGVYDGPRTGLKNHWSWLPYEKNLTFYSKQLTDSSEDNVGILISTSAKINIDHIDEKEKMSFFELSYDSLNGKIDALQIKSQKDLDSFVLEFFSLVQKIRNEFPKLKTLHIFAACSPPVAIYCGLVIKQKTIPNIQLYDFFGNKFIKA